VPETGTVHADVSTLQTIGGDNLPDHLEELVRLDAVCFEPDEVWGRNNFLKILPGKNRLSRLTLLDKKVVGYIIGSEYAGTGHIHRLAVAPAVGRSGIGLGLLREFLEECRSMKLDRVTVETPLANTMAADLYEKAGFSRLAAGDLRKYLHDKMKEDRKEDYTGSPVRQLVYAGFTTQVLSNVEKAAKGRARN
jgi:ribosomal protein S18 acetylase RimI-like enzyme